MPSPPSVISGGCVWRAELNYMRKVACMCRRRWQGAYYILFDRGQNMEMAAQSSVVIGIAMWNGGRSRLTACETLYCYTIVDLEGNIFLWSVILDHLLCTQGLNVQKHPFCTYSFMCLWYNSFYTGQKIWLLTLSIVVFHVRKKTKFCFLFVICFTELFKSAVNGIQSF